MLLLDAMHGPLGALQPANAEGIYRGQRQVKTLRHSWCRIVTIHNDVTTSDICKRRT